MLLRAIPAKDVMDNFHYILIFYLQAIDEYKLLFTSELPRTIH